VFVRELAPLPAPDVTTTTPGAITQIG